MSLCNITPDKKSLYITFCPDYRQKHETDHECRPPGSEKDTVGSLWIPRENVCDGYFDCRDRSDEEAAGCNKTMVSCEVMEMFVIVIEQ